MTDELIKKANLYANNTHFTEYDNPSLSESLDISEEIKQAYIAGAKEMQKENERLKAQNEKMECCANCYYWFDMDSSCKFHKKKISYFMVDCNCDDWKSKHKEVVE